MQSTSQGWEGSHRAHSISSLSEKLKSKEADLKEEKAKRIERAKLFYVAKNITLSHCFACVGSPRGESIISLPLASSLFIFDYSWVAIIPLYHECETSVTVRRTAAAKQCACLCALEGTRIKYRNCCDILAKEKKSVSNLASAFVS